MTRPIFAAATGVFMWLFLGAAAAVPVSESTVETACGDQIEGGCSGATCAMGCEKVENGKIYTYGCTFPNKAGKTKSKCDKVQISRTGPGGGKNQAAGGKRPLLKAD